jgi:hypothetical protein
VPEVNNLEANRLINCAAPPVAVENIPQTAVESIAVIVPTINDGHFSIILRDADWTGAGIVITDMAGQVVYRSQATGLVNEIQGVDLSSGMYIVMLRKEEKQAVLRTVVVKQ